MKPLCHKVYIAGLRAAKIYTVAAKRPERTLHARRLRRVTEAQHFRQTARWSDSNYEVRLKTRTLLQRRLEEEHARLRTQPYDFSATTTSGPMVCASAPPAYVSVVTYPSGNSTTSGTWPHGSFGDNDFRNSTTASTWPWSPT